VQKTVFLSIGKNHNLSRNFFLIHVFVRGFLIYYLVELAGFGQSPLFLDGNDVQLKYNAYNDVIFAKDNHKQVALDYTILGSLISREQGGKKVKFTYDTNEQLTAVINEKRRSVSVSESMDLKGRPYSNAVLSREVLVKGKSTC